MATRRADTDLKLQSGETVVFAGLSSTKSQSSRTRWPILPRSFLDFLAGPSSSTDDDDELVIIVTPVIGGTVESGAPAAKIADKRQP